ncbi:MAG: chromosomal replication initiator protein DnaA [Gammaproteobacteria bacterium]
MEQPLWPLCLQKLSEELPGHLIAQWLSPIQAEETQDGLILFAPNDYVLDKVEKFFLDQIKNLVFELTKNSGARVTLLKGSRNQVFAVREGHELPVDPDQSDHTETERDVFQDGVGCSGQPKHELDSLGKTEAELFYPSKASPLNPMYVFETFVEGTSNQLAKAATLQVANNPGVSYNPLFLYGQAGLGKTHLMQAVGNLVLSKNPNLDVVYLSAERFVGDMIKALQNNSINDFKQRYRSVDVLLIDDIQFFAGKERSQEEFFHTFNALLESQQQIIITSDRLPKELNGIEERLKSRFGMGLTVAVQPPELETRVAILMKKAAAHGVYLPDEVAFFMAKRIRSNVRELEGALRRVIANAEFTGANITMEFTQEALKDLLISQEKLVSMDNIMRTVADYFKVKISDLLSQKRNRIFARPRQVAMALCKDLTSHSLPEIGAAFGGRDHTTVLHACRLVREMCNTGTELSQDFSNLMKILAS